MPFNNTKTSLIPVEQNSQIYYLLEKRSLNSKKTSAMQIIPNKDSVKLKLAVSIEKGGKIVRQPVHWIAATSKKSSSNEKDGPAKPPKSESERKNWPELEPMRPTAAPELLTAKDVVRVRGGNMRKRLIYRAAILRVIIFVALLLAAVDLLHLIPALWRGGQPVFYLLLSGYTVALQISTAGYFLSVRSPDAAAVVIKLLIILNALSFLTGLISLFSLDPLLLVALNLILLFLANREMPGLKYGHE
jgi:hypothetical protein